jgi:hypothetical protein
LDSSVLVTAGELQLIVTKLIMIRSNMVFKPDCFFSLTLITPPDPILQCLNYTSCDKRNKRPIYTSIGHIFRYTGFEAAVIRIIIHIQQEIIAPDTNRHT